MSKIVLSIILLTTAIGYLSVTYFLVVAFGLPVWIILLLLLPPIIIIYPRIKNRPDAALFSFDNKRTSVWTWLVLLIGVCQLVYYFVGAASKYGAWDAWWFWNQQARYFAHPKVWKEAYIVDAPGLLGSRVAHADYPVMLPALTGFFWNILNTEYAIVPYAIGFCFTVLIAFLLFFDLYKERSIIASVLFLSITCHSVFIENGSAQLADVPLSFFLLGAFVCMRHYKIEERRSLLFLCGSMLGCCLWMKNEGMMLTFIFLLSQLRVMIRSRHKIYLFAGMLPFVLALLVFKKVYAPANDLLAAAGSAISHKLQDTARYRLVFENFIEVFNTQYGSVEVLCCIYVAWCIFKMKYDNAFWSFVILSLVGYLLPYIISPYDLEWHLKTSLERVVLQIVPAVVYLMVLGLFGRKTVVCNTD